MTHEASFCSVRPSGPPKVISSCLQARPRETVSKADTKRLKPRATRIPEHDVSRGPAARAFLVTAISGGWWRSHLMRRRRFALSASQDAGSGLVYEIRNLLDADAYPAMPLPDGSTGPWTIRGVESVLFMDGY